MILMKKESRILKDLIKLTTSGDLKWSFNRFGNSVIYSTSYKITKKKFVKIKYVHHEIDRKMDYVVFEYINNEDNSRIELKEIYPYNKLSPFTFIILNNILKKLFNNIKSNSPTKEFF